jgi:Protein of unknown function (DUF3551)
MRIPMLVMAFFILSVGIGAPAEAQNYPWCAQYSGRALGGAMNCGFVSFAQCMATVSGIGGFCIQNNTYRPLYNTIRPPSGPHSSTRHQHSPHPY